MLKKTIKYTNFDGRPVERDFYFHLSKIELAEFDILEDGGYAAKLKKITETSRASEVYPILKEIILSSVGERSDDGELFNKSDSIKRRFTNSGAYEAFIFELLSDAKHAAEFMNSIIPAELRDKIASGSGVLEQSETPVKPRELEEYSMTELTNMPYPEFEKLVEARLPNVAQPVLMLAFQRRVAGK